ncbi:MAG: methyltransferase [Actinomycetota bacterium]
MDRRAWVAVGSRRATAGPYRLARHPMHTAALCVSLGLACLVQSRALACVFGVYLALILLLIPAREEGSRQAYGHGYVAYERKTKRLIPFTY